MSTSTRRNYEESLSSEDSFDWSSDSAPKAKRRIPRKTKNNDTKKSKNATDNPIIKKAKKPGRKPLAKVTVLPSDPKLKRKAQNRAAQRAFRERKEQFVTELQEQLRNLKEAKEKRENELAIENARLKRENERLKEENYILKDAKFTFEFPPSSSVMIKNSDKSQPISPLCSPPNTDEPENHVSSRLSTSSSLSGDEQQQSVIITSPTTELSLTTTIDNSDLFYSKNSQFLSDFRIPTNNNDFLTQSEPLPQLFGNEMDLFSVDTSTQLDPLFSNNQISEENLLKCAPENEKPCKKKIIAVLDKARGTKRRLCEIHQDVKSYCPDINLDQLCEDLRRKITFDSNHILSDADVDLYIECIQRNS